MALSLLAVSAFQRLRSDRGRVSTRRGMHVGQSCDKTVATASLDRTHGGAGAIALRLRRLEWGWLFWL